MILGQSLSQNNLPHILASRIKIVEHIHVGRYELLGGKIEFKKAKPIIIDYYNLQTAFLPIGEKYRYLLVYLLELTYSCANCL